MGFIRKTLLKCGGIVIFVLITLLRIYRLCISPYLGNRCRFYPSCSEYAQQALLKYNLLRALWMILRRILRCQPLHPGGIDLP